MNNYDIEQIVDIANQAIDGNYDILLACRDIWDYLRKPVDIPLEVSGGVIGIASEIDGYPIGSERQFWNNEALQEQDKKIEDYRRRICSEAKEQLIMLRDYIAEFRC